MKTPTGIAPFVPSFEVLMKIGHKKWELGGKYDEVGIDETVFT